MNPKEWEPNFIESAACKVGMQKLIGVAQRGSVSQSFDHGTRGAVYGVPSTKKGIQSLYDPYVIYALIPNYPSGKKTCESHLPESLDCQVRVKGFDLEFWSPKP